MEMDMSLTLLVDSFRMGKAKARLFSPKSEFDSNASEVERMCLQGQTFDNSISNLSEPVKKKINVFSGWPCTWTLHWSVSPSKSYLTRITATAHPYAAHAAVYTTLFSKPVLSSARKSYISAGYRNAYNQKREWWLQGASWPTFITGVQKTMFSKNLTIKDKP